MQPIEQARSTGFRDDEILAFIQQKQPDLAEPINQALKTGYSAAEVLDYISTAGQTGLRKGQEIERVDTSGQPQPERGFIPAVKRGFKGGVTGLLGGAEEQVAPEDETFIEGLGSLAGGLVSDVPAMTAGGAAGGAAGTAIAPGLGTTLGAGAGAFALPSMIKQSFAEYRDYAKGGGEGSFGDFLERVGRVGGTGIKSGVLGATTSQASRLLPILKRMPRFAKLLDTRLGKALEEPAAELATLTTAEAAIEGKMPTPEDIGKNAFAIAGFKLSKAGLGKAKELAKQYTPFEAAARVAPKAELERMKEKEFMTDDQEKLIDREISKREKLAKKKEAIKQAGIDISKKINEALPEKAQKLTGAIAEEVSQLNKNWGDKKQKARRNQFIDMVKQHHGKKAGEMLRSHYKWREALETPIGKVDGKDVLLSDENLSDMMYYRQRTKNPGVEGDTFEALEKRLPKRAKEIMDTVVDEHFKQWVEQWNDNPATLKDINPREGLEDIYLPGVYEETPKAKYSHVNNYLKGFKLKGPFLNQKVFETYAEAAEKAGLKPRYDNIKDLMKYHDELMIKLEANNELMAKVRDWEGRTGEKVFVNSKDSEAYEQAKKEGWVPFEDSFLRMTKSKKKGEDGKYKTVWEKSPDRALVEPAFAKAVQGVFNKEFYKPESAAWKAYDAVSNLMKVMRVSLSTFHPMALGESGVGGLGTKFFTDGWWKKAGEAFGDIDKLAWRAEMGLNFKVPDTETYKEGQKILGDFAKATPSKESLLKKPFKKAAELTKKSHKWIFEEYQPRLKVFTFDKYLEDIISRKVKAGETINNEVIEAAAREVADVVNDQFGGQTFQTMTAFNLNDPKVQKYVRRCFGFPDWSVSALRQAAGAFFPGIKGDLAREYWIRYGIGMLSANYLMRFLYGGLKNKDDDKKNTFTWDPKKAYQSLNTKDPNALYSFPLPDVNLEIAGVTFNPGRDEKGRRLYSHPGKQALEIPRYALDTFDTLFGKTNPVIQATFKQLVSGTPYKGELFPARGKYKGGGFLPWDATRPGTPGRALSRATEFIGEFIPFSFKGLSDKGIASTLAVGGGALPIRKGLSLKGSETYMIDALKKKNPRKLKQIIEVLKDNGYTEQQIRNRVRQIKKFWVNNKDLDTLAKS